MLIATAKWVAQRASNCWNAIAFNSLRLLALYIKHVIGTTQRLEIWL